TALCRAIGAWTIGAPGVDVPPIEWFRWWEPRREIVAVPGVRGSRIVELEHPVAHGARFVERAQQRVARRVRAVERERWRIRPRDLYSPRLFVVFGHADQRNIVAH